MIQHIPWDKLTFTGRFIFIEESVRGTSPPNRLLFLIKCVFFMALDITLCFIATIASYRLLAWALFTPTERGFYCDDESIREEFKENTVPTLTLLGITLAGPFFIIVIANFITKMRQQNMELAETFNRSTFVYLDYLAAFWLTTLSIDIIKCFVGRTRPNFIAMCAPQEFNDVCIEHPEAFVPIAHCTTGWKKSRNSKLSFPSGHAAISVFSTLFLFFYLRGLQRRTSDFIIKLLFVIVSSVFISFTTYCCISRVTDFWHFPTDVLGGVCIGSLLFHLLLHKYYETRPHSI
uniref:Phosphatidic acid phosphatase type 2/haloperoxidase domain-containing protein n=1 Tax=Meloidogyne incognita TaxID=6306 RepID=A0A914M1D9_MELIC